METGFGGSVTGVGVAPNITDVLASPERKTKKQLHQKTVKKAAAEDGKQVQHDIGIQLKIKHAFGSCCVEKDGVQSFASLNGDRETSDRVVLKVGRQLCVYNGEGAHQQFFNDIVPGVVDVLHFVLASNGKYISVCETVRNDKEDAGHAQLSVYSLTNFNRIKTITYQSSGEFICSTFCGDSRYLAAILSDPVDLTQQILVYQWDKERLHKQVALPGIATKICAAPTAHIMLTVSGPSIFKAYYVEKDNNLKSKDLFASSKENDCNFVDHIWLPSGNNSNSGGALGSNQSGNSGLHKMVVLVDDMHGLAGASTGSAVPVKGLHGYSTIHEGKSQGTSTNAYTSGVGATTGNYNVNAKQLIHMFEGVECSSQEVANGNIPIKLDANSIRQSISINKNSLVAAGFYVGTNTANSNVSAPNDPNHLVVASTQSNQSNSFRLTTLAPTSKGFVVAGTKGFIAMYDRTEDVREPYQEMKTFQLLSNCTNSSEPASSSNGDDSLYDDMDGSGSGGNKGITSQQPVYCTENIISVAVVPTEEKLIALCDDSRVCSLLLTSHGNEATRATIGSADGTTSPTAQDSFNALLNNYSSRHTHHSHHCGAAGGITEGSLYSVSAAGNSNINNVNGKVVSSSAAALSTSNVAVVTDFVAGGFHINGIGSSDIATSRSILATIGCSPITHPTNNNSNGGGDGMGTARSVGSTARGSCGRGYNSADGRVLRVWNYETMRCELAYYFGTNEPLAVALHSTGFQVLVSFKDRVRLYNVLLDRLKTYKEAIVKMVRDIKFCNGGQMWAAASTISVLVYDTKTFSQLMNFQGHINVVRCLNWEKGDQMILSGGVDGNVYGWRTYSDTRAELVPATTKSSPIISMALESTSPLFPTPKDYDDDGNAAHSSNTGSLNSVPFNRAVCTMEDGSLRITQYRYSLTQPAATSGHGSKSGDVQIESSLLPPLNSDASAGGASPVNLATAKSLSDGFSTTMTSLNPVAPGLNKIVTITALCFSNDCKRLYAGTSIGTIRVYPWPLPLKEVTEVVLAKTVGAASANNIRMEFDHSVYVEYPVHSSAVGKVFESPVGNAVISTGENGEIFIHSVVISKAKKIEGQQGGVEAGHSIAQSAATGSSVDDEIMMSMYDMEGVYNNAVVMTGAEDIEEQIQQVADLQKRLQEAHSKFTFEAHQREMAHVEELRNINENHEYAVKAEKEKHEVTKDNFAKRERLLQVNIANLQTDQVRLTTELENRYEHKLGDQLRRYDSVVEEIETLRQKYMAEIEAKDEEFKRRELDYKREAALEKKQLNQQNKRLQDEKGAEKDAFQEILDQQEDEYEEELKQLIDVANKELTDERDNINKFRTLLQSKNTKLDQMKKKEKELQQSVRASLQLLQNQKKENQRLVEAIRHHETNVSERDEALAEKEKTILELRNTTRTLENFRIVLDHRLQQLSAERGPITSHIENLEQHIASMYEELVEEMDIQKASKVSHDQQEQKMSMINQEVAKLRGDLKQREAFIGGFKRELGIVIVSSLKGKDLIDSVNLLYKKYVLNEPVSGKLVKNSATAVETAKELLTSTGDDDYEEEEDVKLHANLTGKTVDGGSGVGGNGKMISKSVLKEVEDELIETAKEAERQKMFVERQCGDIQRRLDRTKTEALRLTKTRLNENSTLMYECNDLRREVKELQRKLDLTNMRAEKAERELRGAVRAIQRLEQEERGVMKNSAIPLPHGNDSLYPTQQLGGASPGGRPFTDDVASSNSDGLIGVTPGSIDGSYGVSAGTGAVIPDDGISAPHSLTMANIYDSYNNQLGDNGSASGASAAASGGSFGIRGGNRLAPIARSSKTSQSTSVLPTTQAPMVLIQSKSNIELLGQQSMTSSKPLQQEVTNPQPFGNIYQNKLLHERQTIKLSKEIDSLAQQLDNSERERMMQNREINRLKAIIRKSTVITGVNSLAGSGSYFAGSTGVTVRPSSGIGVYNSSANQEASTSYASSTAPAKVLAQREAVRDGKAIVISDR